MNANEFIEEVKASEWYYPEFETEYRDFQRYQRLALESLNELHRVCEKNNIKYILAYGSLLGAVRDHGQIPWDYDIDVHISISDKDRLIDALGRDLSDKYYFYCTTHKSKCPHSHLIRLTPKGYRSEVLHVDIFYLMGLPDDIKEGIEHQKRTDRIAKIRRAKLRDISVDSHGQIPMIMTLLYLRLRFIFYSLPKLDIKFDEAVKKYPIEKSRYCAITAYEPKYFRFRTDELFHTEKVVLDTGEYYIPTNYDHILTQYYGDYSKYPPLKSRIDEMRVHYQRLLKYALIKDRHSSI